MIAMQYSFTFPADYDMQIIRNRIASKGHTFDDFPGLIFKAFLHASKDIAPTNSNDNQYGALYLWEDAEAMNGFLTHPGFVALTQAFGWPQIKVWSIWGHALLDDIKNARYASREIVQITPYSSLVALQENEQAWITSAMDHPSILAAVSAFEPTTWAAVRFRLWQQLDQPQQLVPTSAAQLVQHYEVGYVATSNKN